MPKRNSSETISAGPPGASHSAQFKAGVWSRLCGYLYGWGRPEALCIFRILMGCYFLAFWLTNLPDIALHFSNEGMAFALFDVPADGIHDLRGLIGYVCQPPAPIVSWICYGFTLLLVVLFTIGWWTRISLVIYLVMFGYFYFLQIHARDTTFDRLTFIITGLLALGRCDAVYSLSAWYRRRRGKTAIAEIPLWPGRLIALQITFMYFGAGVFKITSEPWSHGELLYFTLIGNWATPCAFWIVRTIPYLGLFDVLVLGTMILEVHAPIFLLHRRLQKFVFVCGALFHVAIAVLLNLWPFIFMPLTYLLFLEPTWVHGVCLRVEMGLRRRPADCAGPATESAAAPSVEAAS